MLGGGLLLPGCAGAPTAEEQAAGEAPPQAAPQAPIAPAVVTPLVDGPRPTAEEIAALRLALQQSPSDKRARRLLAIALFESGNTGEALAMFEEDVLTQPGVTSLLNLGRAYDRVLRYGDAEATYRKALAVSPSNPTALHALGNLALKRGDTGEALTLYRQALAGKPDYLLAHAHLADALKQTGDSQAAYAAYARVVELQPANPQEMELYQDAVYNLAVIDLAAGAAQQAADLLEGLLQVRPDHPSAHYGYGQALLLLGREEEARRAFDTHMALQAERRALSPAAMGE